MLVSSAPPLWGPQSTDWLAVCVCIRACTLTRVHVCVCQSHLQLHKIVTKIGKNLTLLSATHPNLLGFLYKVRQNALCGSHVRPSLCVGSAVSDQNICWISVKFGLGAFYIKLSSTRPAPGLACWACIAFFLVDSGSETCESLILVMNCILLYFVECIRWLILWIVDKMNKTP
jgi:hypothetical protein